MAWFRMLTGIARFAEDLGAIDVVLSDRLIILYIKKHI